MVWVGVFVLGFYCFSWIFWRQFMTKLQGISLPNWSRILMYYCFKYEDLVWQFSWWNYWVKWTWNYKWKLNWETQETSWPLPGTACSLHDKNVSFLSLFRWILSPNCHLWEGSTYGLLDCLKLLVIWHLIMYIVLFWKTQFIMFLHLELKASSKKRKK